jgi:hypothetical protein
MLKSANITYRMFIKWPLDCTASVSLNVLTIVFVINMIIIVNIVHHHNLSTDETSSVQD